MSSRTELIEEWDRLGPTELHALEIIAQSGQIRRVSPRLSEWLLGCLIVEKAHREELRTRKPHVPNFDLWKHGELSDSYMGALLIHRASGGGSGVLQEWAELLIRAVCGEMAARLMAQQLAEDAVC